MDVRRWRGERGQMFDVLRFKADVTAARINAALVLTPARRVALVFPEGQRVPIAQPATLQALAERARVAHKQIAIVGGDAYLRACAVTAGLAAATTLDEWRGARAGAATRRRPGAHGAAPARLALVGGPAEADSAESTAAQDETTDMLWEVEPPDYVVRLTPVQPGAAGEHVANAPASIWPRTAPPPTDAETFAAAEYASENREEEISDLILATSGQRFDAGLAH